jgi:hypothetical protein
MPIEEKLSGQPASFLRKQTLGQLLWRKEQDSWLHVILDRPAARTLSLSLFYPQSHGKPDCGLVIVRTITKKRDQGCTGTQRVFLREQAASCRAYASKRIRDWSQKVGFIRNPIHTLGSMPHWPLPISCTFPWKWQCGIESSCGTYRSCIQQLNAMGTVRGWLIVIETPLRKVSYRQIVAHGTPTTVESSRCSRFHG